MRSDRVWIGALARLARGLAQLLVAALLAVTTGLSAVAKTPKAAPSLGLPLACAPQQTCFIQHYVDVAPDAGSQDFRCGHSTYKGHDGVDFRILSAAAARQGVAVLAAAGGTVKSRRDGMADAYPREAGRDTILKRECGNGVVIDHGDGWETQYCHMRQGSVRVAIGQEIERGARLGEVGYSGLADSAHLHLTVRHAGRPVDPFTGRTPDGACWRDDSQPAALFDASVLAAFPYSDGIFLQAAFASRPLQVAELEHDHRAGQPVAPDSAALVFFARLSHLRRGDRIDLTVTGPVGFDALNVTGTAVDRDKAIFVAHAGRRRTSARWPAGAYRGEAHLIRDGLTIRRQDATLTLP